MSRLNPPAQPPRRGPLLAGLAAILAGSLAAPIAAWAFKPTNRVIYTVTEGRQIFNERCAMCHLPDGKGRHDGDGQGFPPLAGMSQWLATREGQLYVCHVIIFGPYGQVLVGDTVYTGFMPRYNIRFNNRQMVELVRYISEVINTPAPGYVPITEAIVEEARRLPDTMDSLELERAMLPPR